MSELTGSLAVDIGVSGRLHGSGELSGTVASSGALSGQLDNVGGLSGALVGAGNLSGKLTIPASSGVPVYDGSVEVTPSTEEQVIHTDHRMVLSDITINPIPSNYGLITWDGSILTVS